MLARKLALPLITVAISLHVACGGLTPLNNGLDTAAGDDDDDSTGDDDDDDDFLDEGVPPTLASFFVTVGATGDVEVRFEASDPDGDLQGGQLRLTVDGDTTNYDIPGQITDWNPGGTSTLSLTGLSDPCASLTTVEFAGKVVDAKANESGRLTDDLSLQGSGVTVVDNGDDDISATDMGVLGAGSALCGSISLTGNDTTSYTADMDWIEFMPTTTGTLTFSLTWSQTSADYDLILADWWTLQPLAGSSTAGSTQPETFSFSVSSSEYYYLVVGGWDGPGGNWAIEIQ